VLHDYGVTSANANFAPAQAFWLTPRFTHVITAVPTLIGVALATLPL
jgi:hypothetical protein